MASMAASRTHLENLEKKVHLAQQIAKKAHDEECALKQREANRRKIPWKSVEDEGEYSVDERGRQEKLNAPQYPDEEAEGFDFKAKLQRLKQETLKCKVQTIETYRQDGVLCSEPSPQD